MRTLTTGEAAALLSVSPNTLRTWEQRFEFPRATRSPGHHRRYLYADVTALASALREGLSVSSAVSVASDPYGNQVEALLEALLSFRADRADVAMEASLAMRSFDRSLEEVLLPALARVRARGGSASAALAFAHDWATEWLRRAQRLAGRDGRRFTVLIGDATCGPLDPAGPATRALELLCIRAGLGVVTVSVHACERMHDAVAALDPRALVVAGGGDAAAVSRWLHSVQAEAGSLPVAYFRRRLDGRTNGWAVVPLSDSPGRAQAELLPFVLGCQPSC